MQLTLSEQEAQLLRDLLRDFLPDLKREVARTDHHALRHVLVQRQELVEWLLQRLPTEVP